MMEDAEVFLRKAVEDDIRLLWDWANDPEVRRQSFSSSPIEWEEHVEWFNAVMNGDRSTQYIAEMRDGTPAGQVRFDRDGDKAVIGVSVDARWRGCGFGARIIKEATPRFLSESGGGSVIAFVKEDNVSSSAAFLAAGFKETGPAQLRGQSCRRYELKHEK